ncbi:aurora kinase A and ninein-interacting protein [Myripristis murdjan]|uniref:aurora kinase A and ninein-interacting protein n=1 Tax=Myripristis murdjan TaxID=586833 RepID=UPI0011762663|nr:aurora kinase A and ninein-interacting protein [Myripristis murdjan]XP_029919434.1 aurora kinase A and ninein-interacting protein [Myripristis murdjan]
MKTSRPALQAPAQEECGVWLDTVQLKGKAKQKRLARPISKLLNPLAPGSGYSLAVALNFTQTKIQMPNTKQSSISSFFVPQRRILNKISRAEVANTDPEDLSSSSSTSTTSTSSTSTSGTKRKRDMDLDVCDLFNTEERHIKTSDVDVRGEGAGHEWQSENLTENEAPVWREHCDGSYTLALNTKHESEEESDKEMNQPERKRRLAEPSSPSAKGGALGQECSQTKEQFLTCSSRQHSQDSKDSSEMKPYEHMTPNSDSEADLTQQKHLEANKARDSGSAFLESLLSEDAFGIWMGAEGRTSTQKSHKPPPLSQLDDEKENSESSCSRSPYKRPSLSPLRPLSNRKWADPKPASSQKPIPKLLWRTAEEESLSSQCKWTKPNGSPLKKCAPKQPCREAEEDSLAMLFTQDSEGFRVIAHRSLHARSPFKDHTNVSTGMMRRAGAYKPVVEDEEEEMLFTQDSQGNMVIKH